MATVSISASTPTEAAAAQIFQKKLYKSVYNENFFFKYGLIGKGDNAAIELKTDFTKNKGDAMTFNLRLPITTAPISGDGWVEGNEMSMSFVQESVLLGSVNGGIRSAGKLSEQRFVGDLRAEIKDAAADWWNYTINTWIMKQLSGATFQGYPGTASGTLGSLATVCHAGATNTNIIYGGDATATTNIDSTDTFSHDLIEKAKLSAKTGYIDSTTQIHKIRPITVNGKSYFIMIVHPYSLYDLKQTDEWKNAMREAERRGPENPLFSGATAMWDGVILYESDFVQTASTWGSGGNVYGATNLLLGAQAGVMAVAQDGPDWIEDTFNYGRQWGVATGQIMTVKKTQFAVSSGGDDVDFGVIAIKTAAKHPRTGS